jgi:hypothetical protein
MNITVQEGNPSTIIKAVEMPYNSIGIVIDDNGKESQFGLHLIRSKNQDSFIKFWPNGVMETATFNAVAVPSWKVKMLPKGTKVILEF